MKEYKFNKEKNELLIKQRRISFAEIIKAIKKKNVVKVINHPNKKKYPKQKIYLIKLRDYIFSVPFIEEEEYFFLKTIIPSRKYTKKYFKKL